MDDKCREAHKRIWLQYHDEDITWCQDQINDTDVEYVRADIATQASAATIERLKEVAFQSQNAAIDLAKKLDSLEAENARLREALHMMDEVTPVTERIFTDNGTYCSVVEPATWVKHADGTRDITWYARTHIIFHKNAMSEKRGLQIIRFQRPAEAAQWCIASNPWSGVYLTPEEWAVVMRKALAPKPEGAL